MELMDANKDGVISLKEFAGESVKRILTMVDNVFLCKNF